MITPNFKNPAHFYRQILIFKKIIRLSLTEEHPAQVFSINPKLKHQTTSQKVKCATYNLKKIKETTPTDFFPTKKDW